MPYNLLAGAVLVLHSCFILFVVFGGLLVLRRRWCAFLHVPAFLWGALIEFAGFICPLTPLENYFRMQSGLPEYSGGFIGHYIIPLIYPDGLTRDIQIVLGVLVLILNAGVYGFLIWKTRRIGGKRQF